jgi:biopolymer transport protein ExbD
MVAAEVAAALITTAAGIIVAISATLSYNLLMTRIGSLNCELANTSLLARGSSGEPIGRSRGFAQTLPLQRRFSGVPPYALAAAPVLASLVAIFTFFQPYEVPTGLPVRLLPIGSLERHRQSLAPVVVSVVSESGKGTAVVRVNSKPTPLDDLHKALVREQKGAPKREAYVEAEGTLEWGDVVRVIDIAERVGDGYVVLVTTAPRSHK